MNPSHSNQTFNPHNPENAAVCEDSSHPHGTKTTRYSDAPPEEVAHSQAGPSANPHAQTLYMPIESPPTPAPSPGPGSTRPPTYPLGLASNHLHNTQDPALRRQILASILASCTPSELLFISTIIAPLLKRDFLFWLPPELSFHILSFIDDPKSLVRASRVSKHWYRLVNAECVWRRMCHVGGFWDFDDDCPNPSVTWSKNDFPVWREDVSYREHYKISHITMTNWRDGGSLLQSHRIPVVSPDNGVVTSLALDRDWIVVGLANSKIHIFSAKTGVLARTLVGHEMGVWAVCLVSKGGYLARPPARENEDDGNTSSGSRCGRKSGHPARSPAPQNEDDDDTSSGLRRGRNDGHRVKLPVPQNEDDGEWRRRRRRNDVDSLRSNMERMGINSKQEQYISPSLRVALGLDPAEGEGSSSSGSSHGAEQHHPSMEQEPFPGKRSNSSYASQGWGQPNALVVSGGCDKLLRVWDIKTGWVLFFDELIRELIWVFRYCIYVLAGHTSTIRCIRVLHNRPIAVSGSRDGTVRVWDIQRGRALRVLAGHHHSVRCLDVCGNRIVSGSYDTTCRVSLISACQ